MDNELETLIVECGQNINKRKELLYQIGQNFLKPLQDRELEEKTFSIFQLVLKNEKKWKGDIMVPLFYRQNKQENIYRDIWYTLRDYFAWCVLYPNEVDLYFKHDENGKVDVLANPKMRIMEKDNTKQVYKSELGKRILVPVKKERSVKIESGFTLGQKDSILTVCVAGLLELPPGYYNKPKIKKEKNSKKEALTEEVLSETIESLPKTKNKNN